ncbi:septum site-determining protein MinC, partial [Methylomagnum sp.]
ILKPHAADLGVLRNHLQQKLKQAPEFFRNAPVIVDLSNLDPDTERLDFPAFVEILRDLGLAPVGVRGGTQIQHYAAQAAKLAVLADIKSESALPLPASQSQGAASKPATPPPKSAGPTKFVNHPIRSGQRIYAAGGDLIVLAQVSAGAEIMADGNIHVYGSLRGRALAGVQGNLEARIFCSDLQAELVAIGGHYKISENLDADLKGQLVQVYLLDNSLIIDKL